MAFLSAHAAGNTCSRHGKHNGVECNLTRRIPWPVSVAALLAAGCLTMAHLQLTRPVSQPWPYMVVVSAVDDHGNYEVRMQSSSDLPAMGLYDRPAVRCSLDGMAWFSPRSDGRCYAQDAPK